MKPTAMAQATERPILFSGQMVKEIKRERLPKTQTRRVIRPQPTKTGHWIRPWEWHGLNKHKPCISWADDGKGSEFIKQWCPYGRVGDRLWVRETWAASPFLNRYAPRDLPRETLVVYRADDVVNRSHFVWRPSIHMPRWASRITLEIVKVRVEQVQDISESDSFCEGIPEWTSPKQTFNPRMRFAELWDSINAKRGYGWNVNPWVWVIEFRKV